MEQKKDADKLQFWKQRFSREKGEYQEKLDRMDRREALYRGTSDIKRADGSLSKKAATHVRNLVEEIIDTQVDSNIPQPKVTAVRGEDADKAKMIEDMLRNELDRLPMSQINDLSERTCPIQGGDGFLPEWDITQGTHTSIGDIRLTELHPKKIIPQHGVYLVEDMDFFFITSEKTKEAVSRRYGVDVSEESEEDPGVRTVEGDSRADEMVTQITAFYRNEEGGIGRYSWVGDTVLEDLEDCQARRLQLCAKCHAVGDGVKCRECGGTKFQEETQAYEILTEDLPRSDGTVISRDAPVLGEDGLPVLDEVEDEAMLVQPLAADGGLLAQLRPGGFDGLGVVGRRVHSEPRMEPRKIPYYKPGRYPLIIRKNVSLYGEFLGASDVDAIESHQTAMNKLTTKLNKKVLGGGSFITKPSDLNFQFSDEDGRVLNIDKASQLQMIQVFNTQVDINSDLALQASIYEQARQQIGITDSMQGRKDATATSAVAKQFSAAQAAGRLESKRTMKKAMYEELFELLFQLKLAYADEPRPVVSFNERGEKEYKLFSRWDFLELDDAGQPYWNDRFLFSCDNSAPLASDREKLWQENRMNLQTGAYGDQSNLETLVLFWEIMEQEHYPMAGVVKTVLQERLKAQNDAAAQQLTPPEILPTGDMTAAEYGARGGMEQ